MTTLLFFEPHGDRKEKNGKKKCASKVVEVSSDTSSQYETEDLQCPTI